MPIRVTCPGCHTRFNVSEKYAGKEGPCPKCKKVIKVPDKAEEVVIHAPEAGPKDSEGRPVLKPIVRDETKLSSVQIVLISAVVIGFFGFALVLRLMVEDKANFPQPLLWVAAILVAIPVVFGAYTFLRDQELGSLNGRELWMRVGICSAIYALLWLAMPLMEYAFDGYEPTSWGVAIAAMLLAGGAGAAMMLELDYLMGVVHASIYFGVCLLGRWMVGIGVFPGMDLESTPESSSTEQVVRALIEIGSILGSA